MTHGRAVAAMVLAALLWSIAGVVTRQLEAARSFEVTFWRALACALTLLVLLAALRGPRTLLRSIRDGGRILWVSGACWTVMFVAFMVGLTLTTVANVLVTMAISPLLTALVARAVLGQRLAVRTWCAIAAAGAGIAWMYGHDLAGAAPRHLLGTAVALMVPVAAAINWTAIQIDARRTRTTPGGDLLPAVLLGATGATLVALPAALPFGATPRDVAWLAMLGAVQLAVPCLIAVAAARALRAAEASLLGLLEVVFGVAWVWLAGGEAPSASALAGGGVVIAALALNEAIALAGQRAVGPAAG